MSEQEKVPTFEEFKELIVKILAPAIKAVQEHDNGPTAMEYISYGTVANYVRERYDTYLEEYNEGKITVTVFRIGCVDSVVNYLYMMYDGKLS